MKTSLGLGENFTWIYIMGKDNYLFAGILTGLVGLWGMDAYEKYKFSKPFTSAELEDMRKKYAVPPKQEFQKGFAEKMYRHARFWGLNDDEVVVMKPKDVSTEETQKWIKEMCADCDVKYDKTMDWFEVRWKKME